MSYKVSDPNHPIWDFLKYTLFLVAATIILWANAEDFDVTEGKSLMMLAVLFGGWGTLERFIRKSEQKE